MTVTDWLDAAMLDAERRGLPMLRPLLENLAKGTSALRSTDWNADATGTGSGRQKHPKRQMSPDA